ncbi:MAG: polyprenyl diphosphate synthase [Pseudomonadota bacterium]|nr:polyprenyl diphosphate synthase [Pseudomonadota bacterium]|tara:strand:- start:1844 stop:2587 length:744 start_codon:yes stop_codon:yes gene_type:complete
MTPDCSTHIPEHIAIIMDGNNRWASSNGLTAKLGHRHGAEAARDIIISCIERNIKYLTLFAFSNENWMRPSKEVQSLMALFLAVLKRKEIHQLSNRNVRIEFIGNRAGFSPKLQNRMNRVEALTRSNTGTTLIVAADYGGRWDISNATKSIARKIEQGELTSEQVDIELVHQHTSLSNYPDPDFCIRTGCEHRISNFLLWQFAYTEFYFTECYWPDFDEVQLQIALDDFASRQRRFGTHDKQVEGDC